MYANVRSRSTDPESSLMIISSFDCIFVPVEAAERVTSAAIERSALRRRGWLPWCMFSANRVMHLDFTASEL